MNLGLVLLALFLLEGLRWAPRSSRAFCRRPWGGYSTRRPVVLRHGSERGLILPEPWAPCLERLPAHAWPVGISPDGWGLADGDGGWGPDEGALSRLGWSEAAAASASGSRVRLRGVPAIDAGSPRSARMLADLLHELAGADPGGRETVIRAAIARRFDSREARRRLRRLSRSRRGTTALSWALAVNLFLTVPVLAPLLGPPMNWMIGIAVHLVLTGLAVRAFLRTTRRLGDLAPQDRAGTVATLVLFPPATARFLEAITPEALAGLDPLAAAAALLDREAFAREARARLAEVHESLHDGEVMRWFRKAMREQVEALLRREALPPGSVLGAPARQPGAGAYCPRCLAQYRRGVARCSDCPGVALVGFDARPASGATRRRAR